MQASRFGAHSSPTSRAAADGGPAVLALRGDIDGEIVAAMFPTAAAAAADHPALRIDMAAVTSMDLGALHQLLVCEERFGRLGVEVRLRNVPVQVRQLVQQTQLMRLIESVLPEPAQPEPALGAPARPLAAAGQALPAA